MVDLDANATTPLAPGALEAMRAALSVAGNPSSIHSAGREARAIVDEARERIAAVLGARPHEIIFTSGGTESCNLAVLGMARAHVHRGRHLVSCRTEHHAVLHALEYLEYHEGYQVTCLPVDHEGRVNAADLHDAIRPDTTLVSLMHANNEIGTIHDLSPLAAMAREKGVLFHTDAVQSFGKLDTRPSSLGVDALSIAGHKFYGPKGVGALWLRSGVAIQRTAHGGGHENSRRPGTENVAGIAGMAVAAEVAESVRESEWERLITLREILWEGIRAVDPGAIRNSPVEAALANTLNVSFPGRTAESLLMALDLEGIGASSGSACMVGSLQPSHVLTALGAPHEIAASAVRFSFGRSTSKDDLEACITALQRIFRRSHVRA